MRLNQKRARIARERREARANSQTHLLRARIEDIVDVDRTMCDTQNEFDRLGQDLSQTILKLEKIVEKHCQNLSQRDVERCAAKICESYQKGPACFNRSFDATRLADIKRSLAQVSRQLRLLDTHTKSELGIQIAEFDFEKSDDSEGVQVLNVICNSLNALLGGVETILKREMFAKNASRKNSYDVAAVTMSCRHIWGENKWLESNPRPLLENKTDLYDWQNEIDETDDVDTYEASNSQDLDSKKNEELINRYLSFVDSFAPRSANTSSRPAFTLFLEDVYLELDITSDLGVPVTAKSGLLSLKRLSPEKKQY